MNTDVAKLLKENERLKAELADAERDLNTSRLDRDQAQATLTSATEQHAAEVDQFVESLETKVRDIASLEHQIKLLMQRIRGSRQETIDPDQLLLFSVEELKEIAEQLSQGDPEDDLINDRVGKRKRRSRGRVGKLPAHLQREIIKHELTEAERQCPCCGELRIEIGYETSEQLELVPAKLKVLEHQRFKYACRTCEEHVVIAAKPPQPIEKGLPGPGLCAQTVLSKYGDHQPLYRQEDIHSRLGMTIRRSTLCGWLAQLADLSYAFTMRMKYLILQSSVIHTDDTSVKMLEGTGKARTAKFWPYLGDWLHPYAVYDFTQTRERDRPAKFEVDPNYWTTGGQSLDRRSSLL